MSTTQAADPQAEETAGEQSADAATTLADAAPVENAGASDEAPSGDAGADESTLADYAPADDNSPGDAAAEEDPVQLAEADAPAVDVEGNGASDVASGLPETGAAPAPSSTEESEQVDQPAEMAALAVVEPQQPRASPFARLFSKQAADETEETTRATARVAVPAAASASDDSGAAGSPAGTPETSPVTTASIPNTGRRAQLSVTVGDGEPLPGVRQVSSLYEIGRRDSFELHNYEETGIEVASAAGLAGLAGGRLAVQHARVDVSCLKPKLVQTLRQIERRFGKPVVVTSGYRNRSYNRQVGGARESKHMSCEAADIQVAGVSKWDIAEYVRTLPGRGGVGTYCHTESVHVDIGSKRDWNWRCRRRK